MNPLALLLTLYTAHYLTDRFILHGFVYRRMKSGSDHLWINFYGAINFTIASLLVYWFTLGTIPWQVIQAQFPTLLVINWLYPPAPIAIYQQGGGPYTLIRRQRSQSLCLVVLYAVATQMALKP